MEPIDNKWSGVYIIESINHNHESPNHDRLKQLNTKPCMFKKHMVTRCIIWWETRWMLQLQHRRDFSASTGMDPAIIHSYLQDHRFMYVAVRIIL